MLADENVPGLVVDSLRAAGHDVEWIAAFAPGRTDLDILDSCVRDARVLITFDKDFSELVYRSRRPAGCGVVLFRLPATQPIEMAKQILEVITQFESRLHGHFAVLHHDRVRIVPLP